MEKTGIGVKDIIHLEKIIEREISPYPYQLVDKKANVSHVFVEHAKLGVFGLA